MHVGRCSLLCLTPLPRATAPSVLVFRASEEAIHLHTVQFTPFKRMASARKTSHPVCNVFDDFSDISLED
ncbi:hypothetical protein MM560_G298n15 [Manis javanica]|nr:hypothetical protein MM560_G298n15 [Manis javanica]